MHVSHQLSREGGLRSYRRPPSHLYSAMNSNNGILSSCHALKKNPNEKGCATRQAARLHEAAWLGLSYNTLRRPAFHYAEDADDVSVPISPAA